MTHKSLLQASRPVEFKSTSNSGRISNPYHRHHPINQSPIIPEGAKTANMNLPEAILLLCLIGRTFCVATEMRRLEAFIESRYTDHCINDLQFFAEVTGRFLLIVAATDLSILLYAAGLCAGMSSAEMYSLWPLYVFHTCGLAVVARCGSLGCTTEMGVTKIALGLTFSMTKCGTLSSWPWSHTLTHLQPSFVSTVRRALPNSEHHELLRCRRSAWTWSLKLQNPWTLVACNKALNIRFDVSKLELLSGVMGHCCSMSIV